MSAGFHCERMLVPTDFSETSYQGLLFARTLASRLGASIDLLHIIPVPAEQGEGLGASAHYNETVLPRSKEMLKEFWERAILETGTGETIPHTFDLLVSDEPAVAIVDRAERMAAGLVVMGTHGRSTLGKLFFGSVAAEVVRHAGCGVVTVKGTPAPD